MNPNPIDDFHDFVQRETINARHHVARITEEEIADRIVESIERSLLVRKKIAEAARSPSFRESLQAMVRAGERQAAKDDEDWEYRRMRDESLARGEHPPHPPGTPDTDEGWANACREADRLVADAKVGVFPDDFSRFEDDPAAFVRWFVRDALKRDDYDGCCGHYECSDSVCSTSFEQVRIAVRAKVGDFTAYFLGDSDPSPDLRDADAPPPTNPHAFAEWLYVRLFQRHVTFAWTLPMRQRLGEKLLSLGERSPEDKKAFDAYVRMNFEELIAIVDPAWNRNDPHSYSSTCRCVGCARKEFGDLKKGPHPFDPRCACTNCYSQTSYQDPPCSCHVCKKNRAIDSIVDSQPVPSPEKKFCTDCNGTGLYEGLEVVEPCSSCGGKGRR